MAEQFWREAEQISGLSSGFRRGGRLQPIADQRALELARVRSGSARSNWRGRADWDVLPTCNFAEWCPASGTGYVIFDTLSARLQPKSACLCLAGAIRELGGQIRLGEALVKGQVVWATGYEGLQDLSEDIGRTAGDGTRGQAVSLRHDAGDVPQLFAGGLHIVPHADGTVAVGSIDAGGSDSLHSSSSRAETLLERATEICPSLRGAPVLARWAGVRPRAKSRAPILGPWPGRDGHFVANGGFKIGFGVAPGVAEVMADLVLDGRDRVPSGFRVEDSIG